MLSLKRILIGLSEKSEKSILPVQMVDPVKLWVCFERDIQFPELKYLLGFLRKNIPTKINIRSNDYDIEFDELPVGEEDPSSYIRQRTTGLRGAMPLKDLTFNIEERQYQEKVWYNGLRFNVVDQIPMNEGHFQTIEKCRAYVNYHFVRYGVSPV